MDGSATVKRHRQIAVLSRIAPGLGVLAAYERGWLRHDVIAGVSVAAVAVPTAIAYAQIIGLDPVVGLYASCFKRRALELAATQPDLKWLVVDGSTVNTIDSTGAETVEALARDLARQGVRLALAGFRTETRNMLQRAGAMAAIGADSVYPTLKSAMNAYLALVSPLPAGDPKGGDAPADASGEQGVE